MRVAPPLFSASPHAQLTQTQLRTAATASLRRRAAADERRDAAPRQFARDPAPLGLVAPRPAHRRLLRARTAKRTSRHAHAAGATQPLRSCTCRAITDYRHRRMEFRALRADDARCAESLRHRANPRAIARARHRRRGVSTRGSGAAGRLRSARLRARQAAPATTIAACTICAPDARWRRPRLVGVGYDFQRVARSRPAPGTCRWTRAHRARRDTAVPPRRPKGSP